MVSESGSEFKFRIIISQLFQKTMEKIRDQQLRRRIYECISMLARGFHEWRNLEVKKIDVDGFSRSIRAARINVQMRMLFEGPIETKRFGSILFIHDACNHDEYIQAIRRIVKADLNERGFHEIELTIEEMGQGSKGLESSMVVFSKPIPPKALLSPEKIDAILSSSKANLLLTHRQVELISADSPLLINGQAGSGKTTVLCHRLAWSVLSRQNRPLARVVFLSYNDKLVKQALNDTKEILRDQYGTSESLDGVEFVPFQTFLKRYVPNPSQFENAHHVKFGRFKQYYEIYRRGDPSARRIPSEAAWHGIRSILKGASIPPSRPPLSPEDYKKLARRRRDFPPDMFDDIYRIGEWYQKEVIQKRQLWDDQDLAWAALNWVMEEKKRNPKMLLYDEIFCDEGQDLTEIEFRLLVALCRQPMAEAQEGAPLVFAGDPLQTINPTGFNWRIIRSEVYPVQGRPVDIRELPENFRSDKRIVKFANKIQEIRSRYMEQPINWQQAWEKDGDMPLVVIADTKEEISVIQEKLDELPPESAVIVWPEESDEASQLFKTEEALCKVDPMNLYTISDAKGLEFRLVVLYKFGSSPEVLMWKDYVAKKQTIALEYEIPLLYFLNRLYVAVTRAKSFLVIVDTETGVDNFWSIWRDAIYFLPRADTRNLLQRHPAFRGEVSDVAWRRWAETLEEHAEKTGDLRRFERARRAYEKANETQKVKQIDARLMEIAEQWEEAGKIYFDVNQFEQAGYCYERAEKWGEAYAAYGMLPTTPKTKRRMAVCKFKQDTRKGANEFYEYALSDDALEMKYLHELGDALFKAGDHKRAAPVLLRVARSYHDREILVQAAHSFYLADNFEDAEKLYREARETRQREYQLSRAENILRKGDLIGAAKLFFNNQAYEKVVEVYKLAERKRKILPRKQLLELAADSYFQLEKYDMALLAYKSLYSEPIRDNDPKILVRVAQCLEKLDRKPEAYEYYIMASAAYAMLLTTPEIKRRNARLYEKAADLAEELGRPREEILSLKIEGARERADFDSAVKFAMEKGDEKLVHELKGHSHMYRKEYLKAVQEFIEAEEWNEALNGLDLYSGGSDFTQSEQNNLRWNIVRAVAKSQQTIRVDKEKLMRVVRQIQDDLGWEEHVSPADMGLIYEKCASPWEAVSYYERYIHERWAQESWLRVKSAYRDLYKKIGDLKNAEIIDEEIRRRKKTWGFE